MTTIEAAKPRPVYSRRGRQLTRLSSSQQVSAVRLFPLWLWERASAMRVKDEFINCVAFMGFVNDRDQFVPYGTGFCVLWTTKTLGIPYIVTALHVIEDIPGDDVWVRVIKQGGGFHRFTIPKQSFAVHQDHDPKRSYIDVAVSTMPKVVPDDPIMWVREEDFVSEDAILAEDIGIGDEVVVAGMLFPRLGDLSGSPVFLHLGAKPRTGRIGQGGPRQFHYLLGLVHGHYSVSGGSDIVRTTATTAPTGDMNSGIAIVVPASKIVDIVEHPDNVRTREEWASEHYARTGKTAD